MNPDTTEIHARSLATRALGFAMFIVGLVMLVMVLISWSSSRVTIEYLAIPAVVFMVCGGILNNRRFLTRLESGALVRVDHSVLGYRMKAHETRMSDDFKVVHEVLRRRKNRHVYRLFLEVGENRTLLGLTSDASRAQAECDRIGQWLVSSSPVKH